MAQRHKGLDIPEIIASLFCLSIVKLERKACRIVSFHHGVPSFSFKFYRLLTKKGRVIRCFKKHQAHFAVMSSVNGKT